MEREIEEYIEVIKSQLDKIQQKAEQ